MNNDKKCKRCKNKVATPIICVNCGASYHPSCAKGANCCNSRVECREEFSIENYLNKEDIGVSDLMQVITEMYKILTKQSEMIDKLMKDKEKEEVSNRLLEIASKIDQQQLGKAKTGNQVLKSYSDAVSTHNSKVLIVQPKSNMEIQDVRKDIRENIDPVKLQVGVKMGKQTKKGGVILRCDNSEAAIILKENIESKLKAKYNIEKPKSIKPRIKILGIHEENNDDNLSNKIVQQNKLNDVVKELKIVYKSKVKNNKFNLIIECDDRTHEYLLKQESIFVGWMRCLVQEDLRIIRCYKCQKYGHFARECKYESKCPVCANDHSIDQCSSESKNCINCIDAKNKFNLDIDIHHTVWDPTCQCLIRVTNMQRNKVGNSA